MAGLTQRLPAGRTASLRPKPGVNVRLSPRQADLKKFIQRMRECGVKARPPRGVLPLRRVPSPAEALYMRVTYGVQSLITVYHQDVGLQSSARILSEEQAESENNKVLGKGNLLSGYFVGSVYPEMGGKLLATVKYPEQKMIVLYFEGKA